MNKRQKKKGNIGKTISLILCAIVTFMVTLCFSDSVDAVTYKFPTYVSVNGHLYRVVTRGANITDDMLRNVTLDNVEYSCMLLKEGTFDCQKGYNIKLENVGKNGKLEANNVFTICPEAEPSINFNAIQNSEKMERLGNGQVRVSFQFDTNLLYMRKLNRFTAYVNGSTTNDYDISGNPGTYTPIYSNEFYIKEGDDFYVEFYVKESSTSPCAGVSVGYVRDFDANYRANPVLNYTDDNGNNICQQLKKTCTGDDKNQSCDTVTIGKVPYCFKDYVGVSENYPTRDQILAQIQDLNNYKDLFNLKTSQTGGTNLTCSFLDPSVSTNTSSTTGKTQDNYHTFTTRSILPSTKDNTYYQAVCDETMEVWYDDPKAVYAGGGFLYNTKVKITRTCHPEQIKSITKKEKCTYEPSCWGKLHQGDKVAGPNEEFDQCITTCDGGKYTQSCINSCYEQVYTTPAKGVNYTGQDNGLISYNSKYNRGITFIRTPLGEFRDEPNCVVGKTKLSNGKVLSSCKVLETNAGCIGDRAWCYLEHGTEVGFANVCNDTERCYEVYSSAPGDGCSENPEKDYYDEVMAARNELERINAELTTEDGVKGSYKDELAATGVYDDYYKQQQDLKPVVETKLTISPPVTSSTIVIGNVDQGAPFAVNRNYPLNYYTSVREQTIHLTQAYISKQTNQDNTIGSIYQDKTLDCAHDDKNDELCLNYYNGGYKYYTNLGAPQVNSWLAWPAYNDKYSGDYSINGYKKNINVNLYDYGTWGQWDVNINCMYGLYNNFIIDDSDPDHYCDPNSGCVNGDDDVLSNCDPSKDICSKGVQYIYREINLDDTFPNDRNPRWNWTGTLSAVSENNHRLYSGAALPLDRSYLQYNIDPIALTKYIEGNGYDIYDVSSDSSEVDYEFTLTGKNILNIRKYNDSIKDINQDGQGNYLDYDQSCFRKTVDGQDRTICTSNFLDDENYITYSTSGFDATTRKNIAICNNTKNQECFDVSSEN